MKAKRFILMLLVMLMSVTGAWADRNDFDVSVFYRPKSQTVYITILQEKRTVSHLTLKYAELVKDKQVKKTLRSALFVDSDYSWDTGELAEGPYTLMIPAKAIQTRNQDTIRVSFDVCHCEYDADDFCTKCQAGREPVMENGVFKISTIGNLYWYAEHPIANAELANDITVNSNLLDALGRPQAQNGKRTWKPFYLEKKTFDGKWHSICGLSSPDGDVNSVGFISTAQDCVIKNLTIKDSYFNGHFNCGSFAGNGKYSTFIACHNASTVDSYSSSGGICGNNVSCTFISCLNTGKVTNEINNNSYAIAQNGEFINCVSLAGTADKLYDKGHSAASTIFEATSADFVSGKATLWLNGSVTDGTQAWYQKIGTDPMPHYGSNGGDIVYGGFMHFGTEPYFSNDPSTLPESHLHVSPFNKQAPTDELGNHTTCMEYNTCTVCGIKCMHESYTNGSCDKCGFDCTHLVHRYVNGFGDKCVICKSNVNVYEPAPKADDGWYEVSNAGQLFWMRNELSKSKGLCFRLVKDIVINENVLNKDGTLRDASAVSHSWGGVIFKGVLDGCGHTVSGLYGDALFSSLNGATIRNLGIIDSYLSNASIATQASYATIDHCYSSATVYGSGSAGLFGSINETNIKDSYCSGLINGECVCGSIANSNLTNIYYATANLYSSISDDLEKSVSNTVDCVHLARTAFVSGEAAFKMNEGKTDGTQTWYQKIGEDVSPFMLSKGADTVYELTNCTNSKGYANTTALPAGNHIYDEENGFCIICMKGEPAPLSADGYYEISSAGNLYWFASQTHESPSINARLMKDIVVNADMNAASKKAWVSVYPIYSGSFDGQGHVISGLYDNALFDEINGAHISRLGVENSVFLTAASGYVFGQVTNSTISDCYIRNVTNDRGEGLPMAAKVNRNSKITNCHVYNTRNSAIAAETEACTIENCYVLQGTGASIVTGSKTTQSIITSCEVLDAAKFASGEVTFRLNGGENDGSQVWYQDVDADTAPVLHNNGGNTVLYVWTCKRSGSYENYPPAPDGHVYTFRTDRFYHLTCKHCSHTLDRTDRYHAGRVTGVDPKTTDGVTYTLYNNYTYLPLDGNFHATGPLRRVYGKCCVATINGAEGNIVIPATVTFNADNSDVPVVAIGFNEERSAHQVTSLTLPKSVSVLEDENYLYYNGNGIKDVYVNWTDAKDVAETEFANGFLDSGTHYLHIPEGSDSFMRSTKWVKVFGFRLVLADFAKFKESLHAAVDAQMAEMYDGEAYRTAVKQYADDIHAKIDQMTDYAQAETMVYPLLDNLFATFRQDQQSIVEAAKLGLNINYMNTFVDAYIAQMGASNDAADIRRTRDEALAQITELLDVYSKGVSSKQNSSDGVRLKIKIGDITPIEINANDVKKIEFYRATE